MHFHKKLFHICKYACPNNDDDNGKILHVFLLSKIIHPRWIILILNKTGMVYLFYHMPPTPNKIWEDNG